MSIQILSGRRWAFWGLGLGLVSMFWACSTSHLVTHTVFETPTRFVRLAVDRTVSLKSGFSHPVAIPPDNMSAFLAGLMIVEPASLIPWPFQEERPSRRPLFSEEAIRFWTPLLTKALDVATPEEIVTFYQAYVISPVSREVTSGGLFVTNDHLHFILSNYRAPIQFMADFGMADTHDDRRNPLRSMAPQQIQLQFESEELMASSQEEIHTVGMIPQERTIAILFRQLSPRPFHPASDQDEDSSVPSLPALQPSRTGQ